MTKKFSMIVATLLATIICAGLTACGGGEKEDPTKTYVDIGIKDAGLGTTFFEEMKKDFEAYYANESFETGKRGVVLRATKKNTEFNPANLVTSMKDYEPIIYMLDTADYEAFFKAGLLQEVSDVMTEKYLDEDGNMAVDSKKPATQSIEDTMYDDYDKVYKKDGKYYAVPYMLSVPGIIYDADLFDEQRLFFLEDGSIGANRADIDSRNCSKGPDGVHGTEDDGLPETWNDFMTLVDTIVGKQITPFTWAESPSTYQISRLFNAIWANYEGYNDYMLNYSLSGTDSDEAIGSVNENNFLKLLNQEGRKAGIKAFYDLTKNRSYYSSKAVPGGGNNNTSAEREFIQSKRRGKPIAMFVENSYWEQESRDVFDGEPQQSVNGYGKRNFKYMPIPIFRNVDGIEDQENTERIIPATYSEGFICLSAKNKNKNAEVQTKVAKLFIKFIQQKSQLVKYTANTGCIRPYDYKIEGKDLEACTPYTRSILELIAEDNTRIAPNLAIATKRRIYTGEKEFDESNNGFAFIAKIDNNTFREPFTYFYKNNFNNRGDWEENKSVEQAFKDMNDTISGWFKGKITTA